METLQPERNAKLSQSERQREGEARLTHQGSAGTVTGKGRQGILSHTLHAIRLHDSRYRPELVETFSLTDRG